MINNVVGWLRAERQKEQRRGRWARWIGRNWARFSYGYQVEPTWLELNQFDIGIADLPPAFAGLRIAQLTDFHCSRQVTPAYLSEAVHLAQRQNRSEEHTSELQSRFDLVCRLLLEKKKA